jgi:hypothetical protein
LPVPWVDLYVPEAVTLRAERIPLEDHLEQMEDGTEEFERLCCLRNRLLRQEEQCEAQARMFLFPWLERFYHRHPTVPYEQRLVLYQNGRFTVHGGMLQAARDTATQALKLKVYQEEMRRFTRFLKRQFFTSKF